MTEAGEAFVADGDDLAPVRTGAEAAVGETGGDLASGEEGASPFALAAGDEQDVVLLVA